MYFAFRMAADGAVEIWFSSCVHECILYALSYVESAGNGDAVHIVSDADVLMAVVGGAYNRYKLRA